MPRAFLVRKGTPNGHRKSLSLHDEHNTKEEKCNLQDSQLDKTIPPFHPQPSTDENPTPLKRKPGLHQPFLPDSEDVSLIKSPLTPVTNPSPIGSHGDQLKQISRSPTGSPCEPPNITDLWTWWRNRFPAMTQGVYPPLVHPNFLYSNNNENYMKSTEYQLMQEKMLTAMNYRDIRYDNYYPVYRYPYNGYPGYPGYVPSQTYSAPPSPPRSSEDDKEKSPISSRLSWTSEVYSSPEPDAVPKTFSPHSHDDDIHQAKKQKREPEIAPRYQCDDCSKSYSTLSGLSKHKQFHCSSQNNKQFTCKYCDKAYVSLGALKMHIRTHTLPCKCHLCGKAFSRPWLLQGHIRTHTGERPFTCTHCGRAFADRSNLRAHLQTHSDVKKYSCNTCSKTFSRMSLLLKHQDGGCVGTS